MCPPGILEEQPVQLVDQGFLLGVGAHLLLHQQPRDAAGVKGEEGLLVGGGHGQVGMHAVEHILQVGGEHLHQPPLQLFPPSAGQKVLQRLAVLRRVVHKEPQRLAGILGAQAFLHQVLGALAGPPVHHVQHILKMVVKGLAADAAQRHQLLDGDLFETLFLQQPEQCLGDLPLHICAHGSFPPFLYSAIVAQSSCCVKTKTPCCSAQQSVFLYAEVSGVEQVPHGPHQPGVILQRRGGDGEPLGKGRHDGGLHLALQRLDQQFLLGADAAPPPGYAGG